MASANAVVQICLIYVSSAEISTYRCDYTFASWFQENFRNNRLLTSSRLDSSPLLCPPCNCAQMALADTRLAYQPDVDKHAGVLVRKLSDYFCMGRVLLPCADKCFCVHWQAYELVQGNLVSFAFM